MNIYVENVGTFDTNANIKNEPELICLDSEPEDIVQNDENSIPFNNIENEPISNFPQPNDAIVHPELILLDSESEDTVENDSTNNIEDVPMSIRNIPQTNDAIVTYEISDSSCDSTINNETDQSFNKCIKFKCQKCDAVFTFRKTLRRHMRTHKKKGETKKKLGKPKNLDNKSTRDVIDSIFKNQKYFQNVISSDSIESLTSNNTNISQLKNEQNSTNNNSKNNNNNNNKNGKIYAKQRENVNVAIVNENGKELLSDIICDLCSKKFRSKSNLVRHNRKYPNCVKNRFRCEICFYTFQKIESYEKHKMKHLAFRCDVCSKEFFDGNGFAAHVKEHHESNRPFKCGYCSRAFSCTEYLDQHMYLHIEEQEIHLNRF